jgi:hypothetical protein
MLNPKLFSAKSLSKLKQPNSPMFSPALSKSLSKKTLKETVLTEEEELIRENDELRE